jgi:hypothetical protein
MGGNTYNRKHASNEELRLLVDNTLLNPLKSLYSDKVFDTEKQWRGQ